MRVEVEVIDPTWMRAVGSPAETPRAPGTAPPAVGAAFGEGFAPEIRGVSSGGSAPGRGAPSAAAGELMWMTFPQRQRIR
jgi:hypothetical protein